MASHDDAKELQEIQMEEAEPWEPWETKLVTWSLVLGVVVLVLGGILINITILSH